MEKYLGVSGDTDGLTTNAAGEQAGIEYWKIAKPLLFFQLGSGSGPRGV